ncbi:MAG: hypothetical protein ABI311_13040 [Gemmatimonadaceae bacterium]
MKKLLIMGVVTALAAGLPLSAFAQSQAGTEVSTAHTHAVLAQSATPLLMAHMHLQHVINCLVGSKGNGFDAAAGDPCKGQGEGAIKDAASDSALEAKLKSALADARSGLKSSSLETAQKDAGKAAAELGAAPGK